jgi:hypothetical protein
MTDECKRIHTPSIINPNPKEGRWDLTVGIFHPLQVSKQSRLHTTKGQRAVENQRCHVFSVLEVCPVE